MGQGILLSGADNIDFMIHGIFSYELFGQTFWITTSHVCSLIVMLIIIAFIFAANRAIKKGTEIPTGFQNVAELVVEKLDGMVDSTMGKCAPGFRNYIGTIFIFILVSNISGLLGLRPPTADYGTTLALGLMTFTLIHFNKFKHQKVKGVIAGLCDPWPFWAPRLFANILSGVVMMALIYGLLGKIALFWPAALHVYFDLFSGAIQTYVFCMLTMTYISDAVGAD